MAQRNKETKKDLNKVPLFDKAGGKAGTFELDAKIFTGSYSKDVLYEAVKLYGANRRVGMASTKQRDEVDGSHKKPWRQKGTGRARSGTIRSPLWRKGGIVFGPHPRNFKVEIPKTLKRAALRHSLNTKLPDGKFFVIREIALENAKTKEVKKILDNMKLSGRTLLSVDHKDDKLNLAARNLKDVTLTLSANLNALDVMKHKNFLVTEKGVAQLQEMLKG